MNRDGHRLEPAFDFVADESSVLLHQSQAEIEIDGKHYAGDVEVRLDLLPQANVLFHGRFKGLLPAYVENVNSSLYINSRRVEGLLHKIEPDLFTRETTVIWCPKHEPIIGVGDESTKMKSLVFHLFNFVNLSGTRSSKEENETSCHHPEHVDLICDEWDIELKSMSSTGDNIKTLENEGGYRLTHIGGIKKADGTAFSGKDADDCLKDLEFFLSFAKGGWCNPVCAVGFDADEKPVWESWSSPREPWHSPLSWFNPVDGSQLATLFPDFMNTLTNNDGLREALREAIYWYLNTNNSSSRKDAGIILTQAGIERLSYEYPVELEDVKKPRASDKFRNLFNVLEIPPHIPDETPELQRLADEFGWKEDAPRALTEVRNSLVHPGKRHRKFKKAHFEAWNLGLWYLEMSILAVCGYSGTYHNRLKHRSAERIENVPWKS